MSAYARLVYPLISLLDAELSHNMAVGMLQNIQDTGSGQALLAYAAGNVASSPKVVAGLKFPNTLGIAAGFDKDVRVASALAHLGFGHIEVGTLTPRPQVGNPKPRIFRYKTEGALINRMGFPNCGVRAALPRLRELSESPRDWILGVSLGKQKETPLKDAAEDYLEVMQHVYLYSDYLAANISSPNTPGLRELQSKNYVSDLLDQLRSESLRLARQKGIPERPIFVKIAPDIDQDGLAQIVEAAVETGIAGIIATNTTRARTNLPDSAKDQEGGMSGAPMHERSVEIVKQTSRLADGRLAIIGVGGVSSAQDVKNMLRAGASVVQMYTGFVYEGPGIAGRILRDLNKRA
ncbi:MAG: quinone-dependent dihydroorotate dehydrogenase [Anaerolineae bacterium]